MQGDERGECGDQANQDLPPGEAGKPGGFVLVRHGGQGKDKKDKSDKGGGGTGRFAEGAGGWRCGSAPGARNRILKEQVPVFTGTPEDVVRDIKPSDDTHMSFHTDGLAKPGEVTLAPFYMVHHQPYAVYWRLANGG
jgi:Domain of unknown function